MKSFRRFFLLTLGLTLTSVLGLSVWQIAFAQNRPLTYPEINTALNTKLPNRVFKNKTELINWLIVQIKKRKVDKPLTEDREEDLRQAGATDELIEAIRQNSPRIPQPTATPVRTPTQANNSNIFTNSIGMEFVKIPSGSFMMGSEKGDINEKPVHRVNINYEFYMGKYEVTIGDWKKLLGDLPEAMKTDLNNKFKESDLQPVVGISWNDAKEFIKKLNTQNDGYVYRLPSEAEWEYAARAGTATEFPFGDSLSSNQANFNSFGSYGSPSKGKYLENTAVVGSYQPNAWGLYDMHGNVWEWVEDIYNRAGYQNLPTDGSVNISVGDSGYRVMRGGAWGTLANDCRSAVRSWGGPGSRNSTLGFRVAASRASFSR